LSKLKLNVMEWFDYKEKDDKDRLKKLAEEFDYVFGDLIKKYKIETATNNYKSKYGQKELD
jgi:hypothetical protein